MSNLDITRLVVGESLTMNLGRPVGQNIQPHDVSKILRLKNGKWEGANGGVVGMLRKGRRQKAHTFSIGTTRNWSGWPWVKLVAAMGTLAVVGVALGLTFNHFHVQGNQPIPVVAAEAQGVKIVDLPFAQTEPEPELQTIVRNDAQQHESGIPDQAETAIGLPIVPPGAEASRQVETKKPAAAPDSVAVQSPSISQSPTVKQSGQSSSPKAEERSKPPTVMLFDDIPSTKPRSASEPAAPTNAAPSQRKPESNIKTQASGTPEPKAKGSGLVAITPDGKSAIFTNLQTRLPVQFKLGEKLPNGEVIKSIDASQGKVITNTKEYSLE